MMSLSRGMETLLCLAIVFELSWIADSFNGYGSPRYPWSYFGYSWSEPKPSPVFRKPMSAMVDLTNDLGVSILQDYSYSRSNFAFSPYGVASVLVVLYEGARGESARQIHRAINFPWDRDITRIGFRDIHRHLRSYFSHEGYLSGITLSKQGSTLKPEYKRILRFYGYDVDIDSTENITDKVPLQTTEASSPGTTQGINKITIPTGTTVSIGATASDSTTSVATNGVASTVVDTSISGSTAPDTTTTKSTATATTNDASDIISDTTINAVSTVPPTTIIAITTSKGNVVSSSEDEENEEAKTDISIAGVTTSPDVEIISTTAAAGSSAATEATTDKETATATDVYVEESTESTTAKEDYTSPLLEVTATTEVTLEILDVETFNITQKFTEEFSELKEPTTDPGTSNNTLDNGMLVPQASSNELHSYYDSKSGITYTIPSLNNIRTSGANVVFEPKNSKNREPKTLQELLNSRNSAISKTEKTFHGIQNLSARSFQVRTSSEVERGLRFKRSISEFMKIPPVPDLSLQLQNGMFDSHVAKEGDLYRVLPKFLFLVDGAIDTPVPMMTYTNVFPFAYIPRLHSKALEFPLDDERYKLLIILPVERRGLRQLIYDLASCPLREVIEMLSPTPVKATVPTFMVEGFVILTPSLQRLGIWDVFDPRKADLSGMTTDPDLYVRNVEQSVTVVIRNYVEILDIQTRTMAARNIDEEFTASHPFLYFVLDTTTNVALMAGQMLDPLNSRIY